MFDPVRWWVKLLAPDAQPGAYNDWKLVTGTDLAPVWLVLIGLGLLVAVGLGATGLRRLPAARRNLLLALRLSAAACVFVLILMPEIELRAVSKVRSRVALMLDASRSMGLATPGGRTRAELVSDHLATNAAELTRLAEGALLETSLFGERVRTVEGVPDPITTEDRKTDLASALSELTVQSSGRDLGAVILYSDGTDTEGLSLDAAQRLGGNLGAPVYAIGFPADSSAADLAIRRIVADDFAFVHNSVSVDVEVEERGLSLSAVVATLKRDGQVVASKELRFGADGRGRVTFEFKPTEIGKLAYEISVPVQQGEAVVSNNSRSLVMKVIRDRLRVLQVVGRPSWDERFLRELLKRNPNVDLISFFILRSTTDLQKAPQEELALIPFPVAELFTSELDSFDVVIFQNFTYRPYNMARFLPHIRDYVMQGGSFLMIGGTEAFEDGWYAGTPISTILPVRLGGSPAWDRAEFRPRLTMEGRRHPVTRIGEAGEPPDLVFQRLPQLEGVNPTLGLMEGARALLVHPSLPGNPPVVAIREVGRGRSMAVTTDSLWYWRFVALADEGAGREFDRFYNNALRWLIRDPELARVRLRSDRAVYGPDDPVSAEVRVLGPDYDGLSGAEVEADLVPLTAREAGPRTATTLTGEDGASVLSFGSLPPGMYMLRATAHSGGEPVGSAEEPVVVEAADRELQNPFPRPEVLEALAQASGGRYIQIDETLPEVELKDTRRVEIDRTRRVPIWDRWPFFVALLGLVSLEWWFRRRGGLL